MAETLEDRLSARLTAPAAEQVDVVVGTSADSDRAAAIVSLINEAYGYGRESKGGVLRRLTAGDARSGANRVLHLALAQCDGGTEVVGCCSSTLCTGWTPWGCGHWGLMAVRPDMQGRGIASALAAAAEARLAAAGCHSVQIEYEYLGDAYSDRLFLWYESSAGFHCSQGKPRAGCHQFRRCRKRLEPAPGEKGSAAASLPRVLPLCQLM
mmetsp:Transcript_21793/g.72194  ORF Transcript_21793/g.72194 Transcript_21793/m.72194 type:complete len:210 (-) Transcript_21793:148-777(-)